MTDVAVRLSFEMDGTGGVHPRTAFLEASAWHGPLDRAEAILARHPELADSDIHVAAALGDDARIRHFLKLDPDLAGAKCGPRGWDALTCLCFSRFLRLDPGRSEGFVRGAAALLDAGADPNTGFRDESHQPEPVWESALYGAAGVARHAELARLLIERGADPNDDEVTYHTPETHDNRAMAVLVESGRLTPDSLATLLLRKADWHDAAGVHYLLEHGADPNRRTRWGHTALAQALRRDNDIAIIERLLEYGADATIEGAAGAPSGAAIAARRGRGDVLDALARRGTAVSLRGLDSLLAACARSDAAAASDLVARGPGLLGRLRNQGGDLLAAFAGVGNTDGVRLLLDLGVDVGSAMAAGDEYWDLAPGSTALHAAAWRARPGTVRLLLERGAPVDARDGRGRTPLMLAVRACVDSWWTDRRSPESVRALLEAGASPDAVSWPAGYDEVDALLAPGALAARGLARARDHDPYRSER